jgi:DNA-binding winged helix-turn-helix (wHTH) protein
MRYFAPYRFDIDQGLWNGDVELHLTRKAARVLDCLVASPGCWVSKATIMRAVWPDTHVQPENVKVLVREIRVALGDDSRTPRFIRSEAGRGYMFVAHVIPESAATPAPVPDEIKATAPIFVGRTAELAHLAEAMDAARASCRQIVLVTGTRGIGKSALCSAFLRTLPKPVRVVRRTHAPHAAGMDLCGKVPGAKRRLEFTPPPAGAVRRDETPALAPVVRRSSSRTTGSRGTRALLERIDCAQAPSAASEEPVVLLLEDLQWADTACLDALIALVATESPSRLMVIATFAADPRRRTAQALQRLVDAAGRYPGVSLIDLPPLGPTHVAHYLDARLGAPVSVVCASELHRAACGNPGLLVAAADDLATRRQDGAWPAALLCDRGLIGMPLTRVLARPLRRRLAQLDGADRRLLEAASDVGLEFSSDVVASRLGQDAGTIDRALDRIAAREHLIARSGSPAGRRAYRFVHPLHAQLLLERASVARQIRAVRQIERWTEGQRQTA